MLREAGAVELHVRIASPPVKWPCFYGIDFATPAELIANAVDNEEEMLEAVRHAIGADTLSYISQQGMIAATEQPPTRLCCACFDGNYPSSCPARPRSARTSSNTCWPVPPAPAFQAAGAGRQRQRPRAQPARDRRAGDTSHPRGRRHRAQRSSHVPIHPAQQPAAR